MKINIVILISLVAIAGLSGVALPATAVSSEIQGDCSQLMKTADDAPVSRLVQKIVAEPVALQTATMNTVESFFSDKLKVGEISNATPNSWRAYFLVPMTKLRDAYVSSGLIPAAGADRIVFANFERLLRYSTFTTALRQSYVEKTWRRTGPFSFLFDYSRKSLDEYRDAIVAHGRTTYSLNSETDKPTPLELDAESDQLDGHGQLDFLRKGVDGLVEISRVFMDPSMTPAEHFQFFADFSRRIKAQSDYERSIGKLRGTGYRIIISAHSLQHARLWSSFGFEIRPERVRLKNANEPAYVLEATPEKFVAAIEQKGEKLKDVVAGDFESAGAKIKKTITDAPKRTEVVPTTFWIPGEIRGALGFTDRTRLQLMTRATGKSWHFEGVFVDPHGASREGAFPLEGSFRLFPHVFDLNSAYGGTLPVDVLSVRLTGQRQNGLGVTLQMTFPVLSGGMILNSKYISPNGIYFVHRSTKVGLSLNGESFFHETEKSTRQGGEEVKWENYKVPVQDKVFTWSNFQSAAFRFLPLLKNETLPELNARMTMQTKSGELVSVVADDLYERQPEPSFLSSYKYTSRTSLFGKDLCDLDHQDAEGINFLYNQLLRQWSWKDALESLGLRDETRSSFP